MIILINIEVNKATKLRINDRIIIIIKILSFGIKIIKL